MGIGALAIVNAGIDRDNRATSVTRPSNNAFNSEHVGVILFCFADGSVRPISKDIDFDTLVSLGGMADGDEVKDEEVF